MRVLAAFSALLAVAQARAVGFSAPETVRPGDTVKVTIRNEIYIQAVQELGALFGYATQPIPESVGTVFDSVFLGPALSNQVSDFDLELTFPETLPHGTFVVTAAFGAAYGVSGEPSFIRYAATITFGDVTSTDYVNSTFVDPTA